ncbi:MAG: DNA-binding protein WhiA, partial [Eubacteriales bacterium]|nr:DNA-binding protein WhiA [Eubacteriales bacterium]
RAELSALYMTLGSLSLLGRGQTSVQFAVESAAVARRVFVLLQQEFSLTAQLHFVTHARFGGTRKCVLTLGPRQSPALLESLGMLETDEGGQSSLRSMSPRVSLSRSCCRRAFLRGAMLGCGTITNPDLGYHLELTVHDDELRLHIAKCLQSVDLPVKQTTRAGGVSLYYKQSDQIITFLTVIGAHQAVMAMEDLRVKRQVLERVNREMNCDAANLQKQMNASDRQLDEIARLIASDAFGTLPPALQEIAKARLRAPAATLEELGEQMTPPLSKSAVNHRMRRLAQLAETVVSLPDNTP